MLARAILRLLQNSPAGWGHPALRGNKNTPRGRGGACPARGFAVISILRVLRRGGIYAARCSRPVNTTYRVNATGRIYASPTNLPEIYIFPIIPYLLAVFRLPPTPCPPQNMCAFPTTTVTPCNNLTKTGGFDGIITKQNAVNLRFCTKTVHQIKTIDRDLPTPNIFCAKWRGLLQNSSEMYYNTPINSARCACEINWRNKNVREDS